MYGLVVNLIVIVSGHPWIINEIQNYRTKDLLKVQTYCMEIKSSMDWILMATLVPCTRT